MPPNHAVVAQDCSEAGPTEQCYISLTKNFEYPRAEADGLIGSKLLRVGKNSTTSKPLLRSSGGVRGGVVMVIPLVAPILAPVFAAIATVSFLLFF